MYIDIHRYTYMKSKKQTMHHSGYYQSANGLMVAHAPGS